MYMSSCLDVKMEDIGQIGCEVKNTATDTVYATLAVCGKPNKPRLIHLIHYSAFSAAKAM